MKTPALIACGLAVVVLSACAARQLRSYVAPTSGPTAQLYVKAEVERGVPYNVLAFTDAAGCNEPQVIGSNTRATGTNGVVTLPAGRMATTAVRMGSKATCEVIVSFFPRAGHNYILTVEQGSTRCGLGIEDVVAGARVAVPVERRTALFGACTAQPGLEQVLQARAPGGTGRTLDDFKNILPGS